MAKHGAFEDVAAEIGFTAATTLVDWFGGFGNIAIPQTADENHPIGKVIGMPAFKRLVKMYEGAGPHERFLWLNNGEAREIARRDRLIAVLIAVGGLGSKQIAAIIGMSESSVRFSQSRVEQLGILPMILKRSGLEKATINPMAEVQLKSRGQGAQEEPGSNSVAKAVGKTHPSNSLAKAVGKTQVVTPHESPLVKRQHKRPSSKKRVGVGRKR